MQNQDLLNLPFDLYGHYELLRRVGELFVGPEPAPRVLEVGGHYGETGERPSLLSVVLPNARCIVAGVDEGIGRQGYVRGRPFRLPFRDQSFDLVCALDVLERLRGQDRIQALAELLRVTRDGLYLNFRYSSDAQIEIRRLAHEFLEPQERERLANGLPDRGQVDSYLRQGGFRPVSFGYGNSDVWLLMTLTTNSLRARAGEEAVRLLNRRFNACFALRDFEEPTCRTCVLLSKRKPPYQLEAIRESMLTAETLRSEEILRLCELLLMITTKSGDHDLRTQPELRAHAERLHRLEGQISDTARSLQEVRESRIWRALVGVGGFLLSFSRANRKEVTAEPAPLENPQVTPSEVTAYDRWIAAFEERDEDRIQLRLSTLKRKPVISVLIAACGAEQPFPEHAVDSVLAQSYPQWQLCIAGDSSKLNAARRDDRIRIQFRKGLSAVPAALTAAGEAATAEYLVLLDHDARIAKDALLEIAEAIDAAPNADFIYSDHDCMDETGRRADPFFKPDWSPDLLLSENYVSHLIAFRKELLSRAGGFRDGFGASWEYDLVLRLTQLSARVVHIPKILCHLHNSSSRPVLPIESQAQAKRAIEEHLQRAAVNAKVEKGRFPGLWRVRYAGAAAPRVSILIPSGGATGTLETCLHGLATRTEYDNFEVVVIDNSKHGEIERLVRQWTRGGRSARCIDQRNRPFNYSILNNAAARQCDSPLLLFLNDDTSPIAPGWLTAMVELGARPEVGAVGAKLLYPNGQIQHAGVALGIIGCCGHAFRCLDGSGRHYFDFPDVIRNVSAVTAACMLVPSKVFQEVGGFDEEKLPVAFNDIDLCLKIGRRGYRVLYTPHALLHHFEGFSKTGEDLIPTAPEIATMWIKWRELMRADPFYSPNLALDRNDYSFRPAPLIPECPVPLTMSQAPH